MRAIRWFCLLAVLLVWSAAHGAVQSVRALPPRAAATAGQDLALAFTWQVTHDAAETVGAVSPGGTFVNAATGAPLGLDVPTTLGARAGGGVQLYAETLNVSGATLTTWHAQGVRRVGYRRTFASPATGSAQTGQLLISLTGSTLEDQREPVPGELRVLRMELTFTSGRRVEMVPRNGALAARLALSFAGSGTLRGRWQVADPGGGNTALFRTIALVRKTLAPAQRATLESPALPTNLAGRYALRFCLDVNPGAQEECADSSAGVQTIYEVTEQDGAIIGALRPAGGAAGPATTFQWDAVPGASLYQLQVLQPAAGDSLEFVTGLLVPGGTPSAALSQLMMSKLEPGTRYRWRVTAHDAEGRLLARSDTVDFVYRP
jgi:hypothetical protein